MRSVDENVALLVHRHLGDLQPARRADAGRRNDPIGTELLAVGKQHAFFGPTAARMLATFGDTVCRRWREPDEGIWEVRGGRQHHTYSKAMCWVALDRLLRLHETGHVQVPADRFSAVRGAIRDEIERRGWNERFGSYVSVFDGEHVDASLLLLIRYGYTDPSSTRAAETCRRVHERPGDGRPGGWALEEGWCMA